MTFLHTCCGLSLKFGTIVASVLGMLIALSTLIYVIITPELKMKTIIIDNLDPEIVRIILAINLAMTIFISILLLLGAIKRNKWLMLPWVILAILISVGLAISIIYTAIIFMINKYVWTGVIFLVLGLICVSIYVYLWCVVYSFYKLIEEENGRGPYNLPPRRY